MKKALSLLTIILISFLFLHPQKSSAQINSLGFGNIQNVDVNNLTEAQIRSFYQQMQSQGLTVQEVGSIAQARGMPPNQVSILITRLNQISSSQQGQTGTATQGSQTRQGEGAELLFPDRTLQEQSLLFSELQRLVQERNEEDLLEQLELIIEEGFPVFGETIFTGASQTFEPSLNIPTPVDYVFGAGDQIEIEVWGAAEASYTLEVTPAGNINIPNIGPIQVGGLKFEDARTKILRNLQQIYSGINLTSPTEGNTFADVSLGNEKYKCECNW